MENAKLTAAHYVRTAHRALRYGFALCSHSLRADVLPTFSKVGARAALAHIRHFFLLAFSLGLFSQRKSG